VSIGGTSNLRWRLNLTGDIGLKAAVDGNSGAVGGELIFTTNSSACEATWVKGIFDKPSTFQGMGLIFGTQSGADISSALGIERMRISSDGFVGIWTTNPLFHLDLSGSTNAIRFPVGTTSNRPTGSAGAGRWETDITSFSMHNGTGWGRALVLPDATPTDQYIPKFVSGAWTTALDVNIGNTDLTTTSSSRVLTVLTNGSFRIRSQTLGSALRISGGTAREIAELYSTERAAIYSADSSLVYTDDGNAFPCST